MGSGVPGVESTASTVAPVVTVNAPCVPASLIDVTTPNGPLNIEEAEPAGVGTIGLMPGLPDVAGCPNAAQTAS